MQVVFVVKPTMAGFVPGVEPTRSDDDKDDRARIERVLDRVDEVLAGVEVVDIHEQVLAPLVRKLVVEAARRSCRVAAAIADEDADRHLRPCANDPENPDPGKLPRCGRGCLAPRDEWEPGLTSVRATPGR